MIRGASWVVGISVVAWFTSITFWIGNDPTITASAYDAFSSYNTSPGGTSQAFAYLSLRRGAWRVRRLEREIALERPPDDATILRIGAARAPMAVAIERPDAQKNEKKKPAEEPTRDKEVDPFLADDEDAWVRSGGRLLIALQGDYGTVKLVSGNPSASRQVLPIHPPLPAVELPHEHTLGGDGLKRFHSILINHDGPLLARRRHGAGEVLLFSLPEAFSNEYLGRGGNLELLDRLARPDAPVYFDEVTHGIVDEASIWDVLLTDWRLGPALAILALAALATFWRKSRPTGPPERLERDTRSDAVDLVRSVGALYDRAIDREQALRLYYRGLARTVHARTGLKGEALDRFISERTRGYDPGPKYQDISREEFQRLLTILNHAYETVGYGSTR